MSKVNETLPNPKSPESIIQAIYEVARVVDREIEFGTPNDPLDDSSTTLAGSAATAHPGTLSNIRGSWVELQVTALDTPTPCYHNLSLDVAVSGEPNVRWLVMGFKHSGAGAGATSVVSCLFEEGGIVETDMIQLSFYAVSRTVSAVDPFEPLDVSLFFVPAVRWP